MFLKRIQVGFVMELLELPKDIILQLPLLYFQGNCSLCIENHKGIYLMNDHEIQIATHSNPILIHGKELTISSYTMDEIQISGLIEEVCFVP